MKVYGKYALRQACLDKLHRVNPKRIVLLGPNHHEVKSLTQSEECC